MKSIIILPTYNEDKNIADIVRAIRAEVSDAGILIVDDNSPDGTADTARALAEKDANVTVLVREHKEGLGKAYIHAFRHLLKRDSFDTVVMMDADFSHDPSYLPAMLEKRKQFDVVVGSRNISGGGAEGWELWRRILSRGGNMYSRFITGLPVSDSTGGFNAINVDVLKKIDLDSIGNSGYAFQIELKFLLYKAGASLCEFPIIFRNRREGESKLSGHIIQEGIWAPWKLFFKYGRAHIR